MHLLSKENENSYAVWACAVKESSQFPLVFISMEWTSIGFVWIWEKKKLCGAPEFQSLHMQPYIPTSMPSVGLNVVPLRCIFMHGAFFGAFGGTGEILTTLIHPSPLALSVCLSPFHFLFIRPDFLFFPMFLLYLSFYAHALSPLKWVYVCRLKRKCSMNVNAIIRININLSMLSSPESDHKMQAECSKWGTKCRSMHTQTTHTHTHSMDRMSRIALTLRLNIIYCLIKFSYFCCECCYARVRMDYASAQLFYWINFG